MSKKTQEIYRALEACVTELKKETGKTYTIDEFINKGKREKREGKPTG